MPHKRIGSGTAQARKRMILLLAVYGICAGVSAGEMRTWYFADGRTVDAEFVRVLFDKLVLRNADGEEWSIPRTEFKLSDADREFLELAEPPKLDLMFRKSIERKNFSKVRGAESRPPEQVGSFGVKIEQKSTGDYNHPLSVECFVLGQEIRGERYLLLDRFSESFMLTKENKRKVEFYSDRLVRLTDLWDGSEAYTRRGEQYYGFIITVTDKRGELIAVDASNKWVEENLETLKERYVGNYMDDCCVRTYPTRPESYLANQAAGRL